jgi:hypothetical protein
MIIGKGDTFYKLKSGKLPKLARTGTDGSLGLTRTMRLMLPASAASDVDGGVRKDMGNRNMHQKFRDQIVANKERLMLPTPMAAPLAKGDRKDNFVGSKSSKYLRTSSGLRTCAEDPIYLNPCFAELVMGFPRDWSLISGESASRLWEIRSFRPVRKSQAKG